MREGGSWTLQLLWGGCSGGLGRGPGHGSIVDEQAIKLLGQHWNQERGFPKDKLKEDRVMVNHDPRQ